MTLALFTVLFWASFHSKVTDFPTLLFIAKHRPHKLINTFVSMLSRLRLFATLWTEACQAPLSTGFLSQEFPPPGDLPDPEMEHISLYYQVDF